MISKRPHLRGSIVLYAVVTSLTDPFDAGQRAEIKIEIEPGQVWGGEVYLRSEPQTVAGYEVGQTYSIILTPIEQSHP